MFPAGGYLIRELGPIAASAMGSGLLILPLLIRTRCWGKKGTSNPQNIHIEPTSRLGGAVIFIAYFVAVAVALKLETVPLRLSLPLLISALPVLLVGLWEDIARRAAPWHRLLAAVVSAALASVLAQGVITRIDLPYVDDWLAYLPFAVPVTWFMVAGACNAINIIDGTHGLAGGTALLMFAGMAIVAGETGDKLVLAQSAGMAGALVGFLLWNYPRGKVFLGDAGAYFIGFMYAELSVQLIAREASISAWFVLALGAYPVVETLFSIYRRKIVRRAATMQPDALHLHSLFYIRSLRLAARLRPGDRRLGLVMHPRPGERRRPLRRANARVAPQLWLHGALCLAAALLFYDNTPALVAFCLIYGVYYLVCYRKAIRLTKDTIPE